MATLLQPLRLACDGVPNSFDYTPPTSDYIARWRDSQSFNLGAATVALAGGVSPMGLLQYASLCSFWGSRSSQLSLSDAVFIVSNACFAPFVMGCVFFEKVLPVNFSSVPMTPPHYERFKLWVRSLALQFNCFSDFDFSSYWNDEFFYSYLEHLYEGGYPRPKSWSHKHRPTFAVPFVDFHSKVRSLFDYIGPGSVPTLNQYYPGFDDLSTASVIVGECSVPIVADLPSSSSSDILFTVPPTVFPQGEQLPAGAPSLFLNDGGYYAVCPSSSSFHYRAKDLKFGFASGSCDPPIYVPDKAESKFRQIMSVLGDVGFGCRFWGLNPVLDLCDRGGGFARAISSPDCVRHDEVGSPPYLPKFFKGYDATNEFLSAKCVLSRRFCGVVADGSDPSSDASFFLSVFQSQVAVAERLIYPGGCFVIKLHISKFRDCLSKPVRSFLSMFAGVVLVKPKLSNLFNDEVYACFYGAFTSDHDCVPQFLSSLFFFAAALQSPYRPCLFDLGGHDSVIPPYFAGLLCSPHLSYCCGDCSRRELAHHDFLPALGDFSCRKLVNDWFGLQARHGKGYDMLLYNRLVANGLTSSFHNGLVTMFRQYASGMPKYVYDSNPVVGSKFITVGRDVYHKRRTTKVSKK